MCGKLCLNDSDCINQGQFPVCEIKFGRSTGECEDRLADGSSGTGGSGSGGYGSGGYVCRKPCSNESDCINEGQCSVCEIKFGRSTGECEDRANGRLFTDKHFEREHEELIEMEEIEQMEEEQEIGDRSEWDE